MKDSFENRRLIIYVLSISVVIIGVTSILVSGQGLLSKTGDGHDENPSSLDALDAAAEAASRLDEGGSESIEEDSDVSEEGELTRSVAEKHESSHIDIETNTITTDQSPHIPHWGPPISLDHSISSDHMTLVSPTVHLNTASDHPAAHFLTLKNKDVSIMSTLVADGVCRSLMLSLRLLSRKEHIHLLAERVIALNMHKDVDDNDITSIEWTVVATKLSSKDHVILQPYLTDYTHPVCQVVRQEFLLETVESILRWEKTQAAARFWERLSDEDYDGDNTIANDKTSPVRKWPRHWESPHAPHRHLHSNEQRRWWWREVNRRTRHQLYWNEHPYGWCASPEAYIRLWQQGIVPSVSDLLMTWPVEDVAALAAHFLQQSRRDASTLMPSNPMTNAMDKHPIRESIVKNIMHDEDVITLSHGHPHDVVHDQHMLPDVSPQGVSPNVNDEAGKLLLERVGEVHGRSNVVLFSGSGFMGHFAVATVGTHDHDSPLVQYFGNDNLASVYIPHGFYAVTFDHGDCSGEQKAWFSSHDDVAREGWGQRVSCVMIGVLDHVAEPLSPPLMNDHFDDEFENLGLGISSGKASINVASTVGILSSQLSSTHQCPARSFLVQIGYYTSLTPPDINIDDRSMNLISSSRTLLTNPSKVFKSSSRHWTAAEMAFMAMATSSSFDSFVHHSHSLLVSLNHNFEEHMKWYHNVDPKTIPKDTVYESIRVKELQEMRAERTALKNIFVTWGGNEWTHNEGWGSDDIHVCDWYGVLCSDARRHVYGLSLRHNNLVGRFGDVTKDTWHVFTEYMRLLDLSHNSLSGHIPLHIEYVFLLTYLDLSDNQLSGDLPITLQQLAHLHYLSLNNNQFTGMIPSWIRLLKNVHHLNLCCNNFVGPLPWKDLAFLTNLHSLHMNNNIGINGTISGPHLAKMQHLHRIMLRGNSITGEIPPQISSLRHLTAINLVRNNMSGAIPPQIGRLRHLTSLRLSGNEFSGTIPSSLFSLTQLRYLDLARNQLTGTLPTNFDKCNNLLFLDLSHNKISGTLPPGLFSIGLSFLDLHENQLSGSLPDTLGAGKWEGDDSGSLSHLRLSENQLTGHIPPSISHLKQLRLLDLSHNHFDGRVPIHSLLQLKKLDSVRLDHNDFWIDTTGHADETNEWEVMRSRLSLLNYMSIGWVVVVILVAMVQIVVSIVLYIRWKKAAESSVLNERERLLNEKQGQLLELESYLNNIITKGSTSTPTNGITGINKETEHGISGMDRIPPNRHEQAVRASALISNLKSAKSSQPSQHSVNYANQGSSHNIKLTLRLPSVVGTNSSSATMSSSGRTSDGVNALENVSLTSLSSSVDIAPGFNASASTNLVINRSGRYSNESSGSERNDSYLAGKSVSSVTSVSEGERQLHGSSVLQQKPSDTPIGDLPFWFEQLVESVEPEPYVNDPSTSDMSPSLPRPMQYPSPPAPVPYQSFVLQETVSMSRLTPSQVNPSQQYDSSV